MFRKCNICNNENCQSVKLKWIEKPDFLLIEDFFYNHAYKKEDYCEENKGWKRITYLFLCYDCYKIWHKNSKIIYAIQQWQADEKIIKYIKKNKHNHVNTLADLCLFKINKLGKLFYHLPLNLQEDIENRHNWTYFFPWLKKITTVHLQLLQKINEKILSIMYTYQYHKLTIYEQALYEVLWNTSQE